MKCEGEKVDCLPLGDGSSRFVGRDGEISFQLKVPVVHPNGEVQWPPQAKAPLMENGVAVKQIILGEPSKQKPGALREAVLSS